MTTRRAWAFRASLRSRAFGWSGTRKAIDRLDAAVGEVVAMTRTDAALAGEGAMLLLEKVSPAICEFDSSSGALGNASHSFVGILVPIIAAAPVTAPTRQKWLERLFNDCQEDDPAYIESLGHHWGDLCASPMIASRWADDLLPSLRGAMADRRRGAYAFTKSGTPCLSALFTAGRFDELMQALALDPNHSGTNSNGRPRCWPRARTWGRVSSGLERESPSTSPNVLPGRCLLHAGCGSVWGCRWPAEFPCTTPEGATAATAARHCPMADCSERTTWLLRTAALRRMVGIRGFKAAGSCRPKGACGDFLIERPVHLGRGRSPTSSRKSEFGDRGRSQPATADRDKTAGERLHPIGPNWRSRP